jgi:hypothetical protein
MFSQIDLKTGTIIVLVLFIVWHMYGMYTTASSSKSAAPTNAADDVVQASEAFTGVPVKSATSDENLTYSELLAKTVLEPEMHQSHSDYVNDYNRLVVRTTNTTISEPSHVNNPVPWLGLRHVGGAAPNVTSSGFLYQTSENDADKSMNDARFQNRLKF